MWALPKLCQRLFLTGFGPCQAALPLRFPVLRGWVWIAEARSPKPSAQPRLAPAQASPTQASPAQLTAARPKPWCGPCRLPNALQRLFLPDSEVPFSAARRLRFWCVFGPFGAAVPLRLAVLEGPSLVRSWRAKVPPSRAKHARLCVFGAQPSPAQPSPQPSPSLGVGLAKALPKAFSYSALFLLDSDVPFSSPAQHSPASPPKPWCGPCQSFAKGFFLPDLARVRPPCRCVSLF